MFFFHINIDFMYILVLEVRTVKSGTKNGTNEWFSWNRMRNPIHDVSHSYYFFISSYLTSNPS